MEQKKIDLTDNNEKALKELLGTEELVVDEKKKVLIQFESEMNEDKSELAVKFTDTISGVIKIEKVKVVSYW